MMWINFLHFYQPATLDRPTIVEAVEKSYRRIVNALIKNPRTRFTFNIQGCLLEKIAEFGYRQLLNDMRMLVERGQIELTGSAAYHPIVPLIDADAAQQQINLQKKLLREYLGETKLRGFFFPEMAVDAASAALVKKLGYEWIILDEVAAASPGATNCTLPYIDRASGLAVVFRQRELSQSYVPQKIAELLNKNKNRAIITATDAELYGLRHRDISGHFEKLLKNDSLQTVLISDFIAQHPNPAATDIVASSWESTPQELRNNMPYALWHDPKNRLQRHIWELARLAMNTNRRYKLDSNYHWARYHLNRGLASCTFWWASGKRLTMWQERSWSPDEIERGIEELIKSVRALEDATTRVTKVKAEKLYIGIKQLIWSNHWTDYWKK